MDLLRNNKAFQALALSAFFNKLGTSMFNLVFVAFAASMVDNKLAVGIANLIVLIPVFLTLFVGIKADETENKTPYLIYLGFIQTFIFILVAFLTQSTSWLAFSIVCLLNVTSDIIGDYRGGLELPIFQHVVPQENLMEAHSFNQFISYICNLAGQALGVYLLTLSDDNFYLVALLNAFAFLVSSLVLWGHRSLLTYPPIEVHKASFYTKVKETYSGLKEAFQKSETEYFGLMLICILLLNALGSALIAIYNIFFLEHPLWNLSFSQSIFCIQLIMVIFSFVGTLTPKDYFAKLPLVSIIFLDAISVSLIALNNSFNGPQIISLVGLAFIFFLGGKVNPKLNSLLMSSLPPEVLARSSSFLSLLFMLAMPLGTIFFTFISLVNLRWTWFLYLLVSLVILVLAQKLNSR